jgi:hypothetical protein
MMASSPHFRFYTMLLLNNRIANFNNRMLKCNPVVVARRSVIIVKLYHLERWLSGRKRQIANLLYGSKGRTEGSNPSLSV